MNSYKIYIVEDMGVTRAALSNILTRNGHIVLGSSATAEKAWLEIENLNPDIILLDLNLKGSKSGLWLAGKIRTHLKIPFIFITAYGSNDIITKITDLKADGYIMKPFNNSTLLANIQIAVANFKKKIIDSNEEINAKNYFLLKTKSGIQKITTEEIVYMKSEGNYIHLFTETQSYISRYKLNDLLNELNNKKIKRTHRRYAINTSKMTSIQKNEISINDIKVPVSKTFFPKIELMFNSILK